MCPWCRGILLRVHLVKNEKRIAKRIHSESFKDNICSMAMYIAVVKFRRVHPCVFLQLSRLDSSNLIFVSKTPSKYKNEASTTLVRDSLVFNTFNQRKRPLVMVSKLALFCGFYSCFIMFCFY